MLIGVGPVLLMGAVCFPILASAVTLDRLNTTVNRVHQARAKLSSLQTSLGHASLSTTGFLLTRQESFLEQLEPDRVKTHGLLRQVSLLLQEPEDKAAAEEVRRAVDELWRGFENDIARARTGDLQAEPVSTTLLREANELRAAQGALQAALDRTDADVVESMASVAQSRRGRLLLALGLVAVALGAVIASLRLFFAGITRRLAWVAENAEAIVSGATPANAVAGSDEIGMLAATMEEAGLKLRAQALGLSLAIKAARIEIVEIVPSMNQVKLLDSGRVLGHLGNGGDSVPSSLGAWLKDIHAEDRDRVIEGLLDLRPGVDNVIAFRVGSEARGWRWLELRGTGGALREETQSIDSVSPSAPGAKAMGTAPLWAGQPPVFGVLMDVTERHALEDELRATVEEADRSNAAKSDFLSRMSHELRTPLNAVLGFAQLLEMGQLNQDQAENVSHILRGGRLLLGLINEVLDLSQIEAGQLALSMEPVPLRDIVQGAVSLLGPFASDRSVDVALAPSEANVATADRQRLKQVVMNLISNAIKYNRRGGSVTVRVAHGAEGRVRIVVSDTGPGIPPEKMPRLFQAFDRLGAEGGPAEGTGLGLALSKRLTIAMGGEILVESEYGRGSTFSIDLARADEDSPRCSTVEISKPREGKGGPSLKVLYVEDSSTNVLLVENVVSKRENVALTSIMSGGVALETARALQPGLVLLDLNLPDLPGEVVLRRLREDPGTKDIPVVILSADATIAQIDRMIDLGAESYLTKPIDVGTLLSILDAHAARSQAT